MDIRETEFIRWLTEKCRIRHYHAQSRNKIIEFMVQLEVKIKEQWFPVVRYDTAHHFAHRDTYHRNGKIEKVPLGMLDYNSAMTFAEEELKKNWSAYLVQFMKEENDHE